MKFMRYSADVKSIFFLFAALAVMAWHWSNGFGGFLLVVSCFLSFFVCVINHNHQHLPIFTNKTLNSIFGILLSLGFGQPATAIVPMHNRNHHVYNNQSADYVRVDILNFRWNIINLILFPFVAIVGFFHKKTQDILKLKKSSPQVYRHMKIERMVFYPLIIILFIIDYQMTFLAILLPYLAGQWGILAINHVQHDGCLPMSQFDHSRNFISRWMNWWTFNNGFHTVHHNHPNLHWSELPRKHSEISENIHPSLMRRSLLWMLFVSYFIPGCRPNSEGLLS